jgi:sugar phosphate isomerase/epimerase
VLLCTNATKAALAATDFGAALDNVPTLRFPLLVHERIAVSSYPFREFIAGAHDPAGASGHKVDLKDFAAHVQEKFGIKKIEPWSQHFRSLEPAYLEELRASVQKARAAIVNVTVDGEHSPYAMEKEEREKAVEFSKKWIDVAAAIGSPSVRTNIPHAKGVAPDLERAADSLRQVAEYGASKNVVVNLENDNPISEDPFFLTQLIDKVNSQWLRALPDFGNSLTTGAEQHAYAGIDAMFGRAYNICHVKAMESNDDGQVFHVDLAKTFGILKNHAYKGYCSMEWDSPGDPYAGTKDLIADTLRYLA